jgi:hypothetical protein
MLANLAMQTRLGQAILRIRYRGSNTKNKIHLCVLGNATKDDGANDIIVSLHVAKHYSSRRQKTGVAKSKSIT